MLVELWSASRQVLLHELSSAGQDNEALLPKGMGTAGHRLEGANSCCMNRRMEQVTVYRVPQWVVYATPTKQKAQRSQG